jgi:hypothetical protein
VIILRVIHGARLLDTGILEGPASTVSICRMQISYLNGYQLKIIAVALRSKGLVRLARE